MRCRETRRTTDNHALLAAQQHALAAKLPLVVAFVVYRRLGPAGSGTLRVHARRAGRCRAGSGGTRNPVRRAGGRRRIRRLRSGRVRRLNSGQPRSTSTSRRCAAPVRSASRLAASLRCPALRSRHTQCHPGPDHQRQARVRRAYDPPEDPSSTCRISGSSRRRCASTRIAWQPVRCAGVAGGDPPRPCCRRSGRTEPSSRRYPVRTPVLCAAAFPAHRLDGYATAIATIRPWTA